MQSQFFSFSESQKVNCYLTIVDNGPAKKKEKKNRQVFAS